MKSILKLWQYIIYISAYVIVSSIITIVVRFFFLNYIWNIALSQNFHHVTSYTLFDNYSGEFLFTFSPIGFVLHERVKYFILINLFFNEDPNKPILKCYSFF